MAKKKKTNKKRTVKRTKSKRRIKKSLANLPASGRKGGGVRYVLNTGFEFLYELRDLVLKSSPAEKDRLIERIGRLGRIRLAIIAGIFMNKENIDPTVADLLIVGDDIEQRKVRVFLKTLEAEVGKEIKLSVMEKDEFQYRFSMFDRFIRVLLEGPHEKLINKLGL